MRLFHVSDTHLGFSAFARLDPERGINQREADFYDSFAHFVDICLKEMPDAVLHTGDLFDSVRPSNRAIYLTLEQIKRLTEAGIDFIVISGNHETPRLRETGSVFRILDQLTDCHLTYEGSMKRLSLDGLEIFCLPHTSEEQFRQGMEEVRTAKKEHPSIAMLHAGIVGLDVFRMGESNELILNSSDLDPEMEYVALGHYHNHVDVRDNASYAGSLERASISEASGEKGFIDLDLDSAKRKFVSVPVRKMIDFPPLDLHAHTASEAREEILDRLNSSDLDGAIVRMCIVGLSPEARRDLDINRIRRSAQAALSFELRISGKDEEQAIQGTTPRMGVLEDEFSGYLARASIEAYDKRRLKAMAMEFFSRGRE